MAAGLGFIEFTTGDVLSAAAANGYLASQTVMVFADAAARTSAIASPQEGMFSFLKDTNATQFYDGAAWVNLDTTGMVNPMTTTGDVIYSSSGTTPARLGIGTAGQVLTVNSGATAPEWATVASGGMTSLASGSLTGASVTLSTISGSYNDLVLVLRDYYASSNFGIQITVNAVADYTFLQNATQTTSGSGSQSYSEVGSSVFTTHYSNMLNSDNNNFTTVRFFDYANTVSRKCIQSNSGYLTSTSVKQSALNYGHANMSAAISSITIATSGGTFSGGTYVLYGVK